MGKYIKGSGYTPIYVCTRYESGREFPMCAVGSALSFDEAMRYANGDISHYLDRGWQIDTEYCENEDYNCELINPNNNDYVRIRVNMCALLHN